MTDEKLPSHADVTMLSESLHEHLPTRLWDEVDEMLGNLRVAAVEARDSRAALQRETAAKDEEIKRLEEEGSAAWECLMMVRDDILIPILGPGEYAPMFFSEAILRAMKLDKERPGVFEKARKDAERLDWLEKMADEPGGLLLHNGDESGRLGLGMRGTGRSLREAVDQAARQEGRTDG